MRTSHRFLGQALLGLAMLVSGAVGAQEVWVITDSSNPVTGKAAFTRLIELDAPQRFEAELAVQLPSDPQRAAALVQQRLKQGSQPLQTRMRNAYQGVADAWSLGITTLPAIVVDQRYVGYGEPDLDKALARVAQHRKDKP